MTVDERTAESNTFFLPTFTGTAPVNRATFAARVDSTTGGSPIATNLTDIDGDGKPDIVTANQTGNSVSVLRNLSAGSVLNLASKVDATVGFQPIGLAVGDLDGDTKPDVVTTSPAFATISILRNTSTTGVISFAAKVDSTVGAGPFGVALGDLDGDGKLDIVTANAQDNTLSILFNTSAVGIVSFATAQAVSVGHPPSLVALTDVDGDGRIDAVVGGLSGTNVSILRNTSTHGTAAFDPAVNLTTGSAPARVVAGDVDGDVKNDLIVGYNNNGGVISVFRNTSTSGTVGFATAVNVIAGSFPTDLALGDISGDGKPDIVTANVTGFNTSVLTNLSTAGSVSFRDSVTYVTSAGNPHAPSIADLNGDAKPDLVIGRTGTNIVNIFLQRSPAPPVIALSIPGTGATATAKGISAAIIDPDSVVSGTLQYRAGGKRTWNAVAMARTPGSDSLFTGQIPSGAVTDRGLEIRLIAVDLGGLADTTGVTGVRVTVASTASGSALTLPQAAIGDTASATFKQQQKAKYRMLSIPVALTTTRADSLLVVLGVGDFKKGRVFRWNGTQYVDAATTNLTPGTAVWVITAQPNTLTTGPGTSSTTVPATPISILANGFTQIGVPYTFSVPFDSIRAANQSSGSSILDSQAWQWNGTGYESVTQLDPWKGYWVRNLTSTTTLTIPAIGTDAATPKEVVTAHPINVNADDWSLQWSVQQGGMTDAQNETGVRSGATEGWDTSDYAEPPPLGEGTVALYVAHPDWPTPVSGLYAGDFRTPGADGYSWPIMVDAGVGGQPVTLTVTGLERLPSEYSALLVDLDHYRETNLRSQNTLTYAVDSNKDRRRFQVIVGPADYVALTKATLMPTVFSLEANAPNPFNPDTVIRFALPAPSPVKLVIYNILGQLVTTLIDGPMAAGYHQVVWQGRNGTGQAVASGVYLYAIQAGSFHDSRKMTLLK